MRIIAFDCPTMPDAPWERRIALVRKAVEDADFDRIEWAPYSRVTSVKAMLASLHEVRSRAGEGLILRKPGSLYRPGYSDNIIKLKHGA